MAAASLLQYVHLAYFPQSKPERPLFQAIKRGQVDRIVELGIGSLKRSISLIQVAQRYAGEQSVAYTGIDRFDARPSTHPALLLKEAYRELRATAAQVRLVPGELAPSLVANANAHQGTGLLVISADMTDADLEAVGFYLPRMLHQSSAVFREQTDGAGQISFQRLSHAQLAKLADQKSPMRRAA